MPARRAGQGGQAGGARHEDIRLTTVSSRTSASGRDPSRQCHTAAVPAGTWRRDGISTSRPDQRGLERVEQKELALKQDLESKQAQGCQSRCLDGQLEDIKQSFGDMLKRLPNKTEVAAFWSTSRSRGSGPAWSSSCSSPATSGRPNSTWSCRSRSGSPGAITSSVSSSVASPIFHASSPTQHPDHL